MGFSGMTDGDLGGSDSRTENARHIRPSALENCRMTEQGPNVLRRSAGRSINGASRRTATNDLICFAGTRSAIKLLLKLCEGAPILPAAVSPSKENRWAALTIACRVLRVFAAGLL